MTTTELKKSITLFFNAYWLKEYYMLLKYHSFNRKPTNKPLLLSLVDSRRQGKGLTDRFKGIISVYALAKATNNPYRCLYTHPFNLTGFFLPNTYDWRLKEGELSMAINDVRFKLLRKQHTIKRLLKVFPLKKQIHVYANLDYLDEINRIYGTNYQWGALFHELFKPTDLLKQHVENHRNEMGSTGYVACVFRFQSLLGDFKEYQFNSLDPEDRARLIERNKEALRKITSESEQAVLVTSDSSTFLEAVKDIKNVYTISGKVVHMDCVDDELPNVYMRSFVDFLLLSHAKKIYSIGTDRMYRSDFPAYAAKLNNVPFTRILI